VEALGDAPDRPYGDRRADHAVHRAGETLDILDGTEEGRDLPGGMDPRIGAPGDREPDGSPERAFEGRLEGPLHGGQVTLPSPAVEVGAVVREVDAERAGGGPGGRPPGRADHAYSSPTSSIRAIGAASPCRGPSFRMRV